MNQCNNEDKGHVLLFLYYYFIMTDSLKLSLIMVPVNFLKPFILQEVPQDVIIRSEKLLKSNREVLETC